MFNLYNKLINQSIGPDHLAAIFPSSIGKSYLSGMKLGAAWGLGHSISASILGLGGYLLKGRFTAKLSTLQKVSALTEMAVGLSLLLIGVIGVRENLTVEPEVVTTSNSSENEKSVSETATTSKQAKSIKALFVNGFIHGFSWDGAPSLAPALAMNSWGAAVSFILAYCFGTTAIMSATAGAVGESTLRLNKIVQSKDLTRNLSIGSSLVAIGVGIFWILNVVFGSG